ncbi:hypothetical protein [Acinetobacter sp. ANC 4173]|uniref:hypothetical protein n=1 Tax=Acinetobacter sp. ANC 4173 TaxID=2529837 RepID=UPI001039AEF1|nr:hypothetical protein [Acinetobacter sp. ANC 4173]TCB77454.1 hypothetical protein E0H94_14775 [Acinetobacter sp. ANC 4173]
MRFDLSDVIYKKNDRVYVDVNMDGLPLISPLVLVGYIPQKPRYRSARVLLDMKDSVTCALDDGKLVIIPKSGVKPVIRQVGVLRIAVEKEVEVVVEKKVKSEAIKDLNLAIIISQSILIFVMLLLILLF